MPDEQEDEVKYTIEKAQELTETPTWAAAALKARHQWPIGKLVSLRDYKAKLKDMLEGHTDGSEGEPEQ